MRTSFSLTASIIAVFLSSGCSIEIGANRAVDSDGNTRFRAVSGVGSSTRFEYLSADGVVQYALIGSTPYQLLVTLPDQTQEYVTIARAVVGPLQSKLWDAQGVLRFSHEVSTGRGIYHYHGRFYSPDGDRLLTLTADSEEMPMPPSEVQRTGKLTFHLTGEVVNFSAGG